jgi:outer membrane protein TolC
MKLRYMNRFVQAILMILTAVAVLSASQNPLAETLKLNLDEAIALGLGNSTVIESKRIAVDSSRAGVSAAKSGFFPDFSANVNWTHNFQQSQSPSVSFAIGEETLVAPGAFVFAQDPVTVAFDLSQPIYTFGRLKYGVNLASEGLHLSKLDLTEEERNLVVDIKRAFYSYLLAEAFVSVQEETLAQREDTLRVARERFEAGLVPDFEVLSAESDVENFKPEVISALNQMELTLLAVMDLLNITDREDYDIDLVGEIEPVYFNFERQKLVDLALENNYELMQYRSSINFAQHQESLKRAERRPIIGSFLNYNLNSTFNTSTGANDYTNWDDLLRVGINVTVPLSALVPYSKEHAEMNRASLDLAELQTNVSSIQSSIKIGIDSILLKIKEEEAKIESSEKAVELASRLYDSASERFTNGLITRIELKETEIRLNSARVGYLTSVYNYMGALFDLMDVVGLYEFDMDLRRSS